VDGDRDPLGRVSTPGNVTLPVRKGLRGTYGTDEKKRGLGVKKKEPGGGGDQNPKKAISRSGKKREVRAFRSPHTKAGKKRKGLPRIGHRGGQTRERHGACDGSGWPYNWGPEGLRGVMGRSGTEKRSRKKIPIRVI